MDDSDDETGAAYFLPGGIADDGPPRRVVPGSTPAQPAPFRTPTVTSFGSIRPMRPQSLHGGYRGVPEPSNSLLSDLGGEAMPVQNRERGIPISGYGFGSSGSIGVGSIGVIGSAPTQAPTFARPGTFMSHAPLKSVASSPVAASAPLRAPPGLAAPPQQAPLDRPFGGFMSHIRSPTGVASPLHSAPPVSIFRSDSNTSNSDLAELNTTSVVVSHSVATMDTTPTKSSHGYGPLPGTLEPVADQRRKPIGRRPQAVNEPQTPSTIVDSPSSASSSSSKESTSPLPQHAHRTMASTTTQASVRAKQRSPLRKPPVQEKPAATKAAKTNGRQQQQPSQQSVKQQRQQHQVSRPTAEPMTAPAKPSPAEPSPTEPNPTEPSLAATEPSPAIAAQSQRTVEASPAIGPRGPAAAKPRPSAPEPRRALTESGSVTVEAPVRPEYTLEVLVRRQSPHEAPVKEMSAKADLLPATSLPKEPSRDVASPMTQDVLAPESTAEIRPAPAPVAAPSTPKRLTPATPKQPATPKAATPTPEAPLPRKAACALMEEVPAAAEDEINEESCEDDPNATATDDEVPAPAPQAVRRPKPESEEEAVKPKARAAKRAEKLRKDSSRKERKLQHKKRDAEAEAEAPAPMAEDVLADFARSPSGPSYVAALASTYLRRLAALAMHAQAVASVALSVLLLVGLHVATYAVGFHRLALRGLLVNRSIGSCFAFLYLFPLLVQYVIPWAPPWAPVCLWYAFLVQLFCTQGSTAMVATFRILLPLVFLVEGVSHHSFLLDLNGAELLLISFILSALKTGNMCSPVFFLSLSLQCLSAVFLGSELFVQWGQLAVALYSLNAMSSLHQDWSLLEGGDDAGHRHFIGDYHTPTTGPSGASIQKTKRLDRRSLASVVKGRSKARGMSSL
ncbi:hypothetical protein ACHHYP_01823 [Achlya hypogyna]|uniref:Transmembrane protein n=1 Tax=Achlya hypogyna TaxID=1202772 RepID=A0A1V9ZSW5_ACHHY|nr:hypothetical protein ACHHYP_01823 [Achlya hypogyna]